MRKRTHEEARTSNVSMADLSALVSSMGYAAPRGHGGPVCRERCVEVFQACVAQLERAAHRGPYTVAPRQRQLDACQRRCQ